MEELKHLIHGSGVDIVGVSETWLVRETLSQTLAISGYDIVRNDRHILRSDANVNPYRRTTREDVNVNIVLGQGDVVNNTANSDTLRKGGAVCLYISKLLKYKTVFKSSNYGICESLFVEVLDINDVPTLVGAVYLPYGNIESFENLHSELFEEYTNIIVMGDFNRNIFNESISTEFRSMCHRIGLYTVHNCMPTHIDLARGRTSLIDFFSCNSSFVENTGQFFCPFNNSYHSFIYLSHKFMRTKSNSVVEFKDYSRIDYNQLYTLVGEFGITQIFNTNDIDLQLSYLELLINNLHSKVPISRVYVKEVT